MKVHVKHSCKNFDSYRAARVKSLFNAERGYEFEIEADLPAETADWKLGVIVGPSGSGKSSLGNAIWGEGFFHRGFNWPVNKPIIDAILPTGEFNAVCSALSAVGLGSVPAWLRPFHVLSTGEKFRAELARIVAEQPKRIVVDEFTSVVDRQIAKIGAMAFAKTWRRGEGQAVLLTCHRDVLDWLEPDWVFDTSTGKFSGRCLRRRPKIVLTLWETDWRHWPLFEPHHYLKLPNMVCSTNYVAKVKDELVAHVAVSPRFEVGMMRACRLVIMPEWQGAGVGVRFLEAVCARQLKGLNRWQRRVRTMFHTSHPGLCAALRRRPTWRQCSAILYGGNKARSQASLKATHERRGTTPDVKATGWGGHFRAIQGFVYEGGVA